MRDRLDELIDQFHGNDRKFAEACFRHGLEQCNEMARLRNGINWGRWDIIGTGEIQPAPAEERHPEQDAVHAAQAERYKPAPAEEKVPVRCPTCGGLPHPYPPSLDRRKGERRVQLNGTYWVATGGNRRCCDRRKP